MLLRQPKREEKAMKAKILESVAARAANGWQRAGSKFDFEVLAMPGGSVMAPALWVYSMMSSALKRSQTHSIKAQSADTRPALDAAAAARARDAASPPEAVRAPSAARAPGAARASREEPKESAIAMSCPWPRCHCT
jgi:hypothetical protein